MWVKAQWTKEFNFNIYFVALNDLDHATSKSFFFDSKWPLLWFIISPPLIGAPLIYDFHPSKYLSINSLSKEKIKKGMLFPVSIFDVDRRACFVFIPMREGKLVIILVSVYARMPILDMNTDEMGYEWGMNDV